MNKKYHYVYLITDTKDKEKQIYYHWRYYNE